MNEFALSAMLESDVYGRQILTPKVGPRAERIDITLTEWVLVYHR